MLADILSSIETLGWQVWPTQKPQNGHRWLGRGGGAAQGDNYIQVIVSEKVRLGQDQDRVQGDEIFMLETGWYQVLE